MIDREATIIKCPVCKSGYVELLSNHYYVGNMDSINCAVLVKCTDCQSIFSNNITF